MNTLIAVAIVIMDKVAEALPVIFQLKSQVVKLVMLKILMGIMTKLIVAVAQVWIT